MNLFWSDSAWNEYVNWQSQDKKTLKRINELIKDINRNGASKGIGKPERLKYHDGWSRRIDDKHRLVYDVDKDGNIIIASCYGHYRD